MNLHLFFLWRNYWKVLLIIFFVRDVMIYHTEKRKEILGDAASLEIIEKGPLRASFRVKYKISDKRFDLFQHFKFTIKLIFTALKWTEQCTHTSNSGKFNRSNCILRRSVAITCIWHHSRLEWEQKISQRLILFLVTYTHQNSYLVIDGISICLISWVSFKCSQLLCNIFCTMGSCTTSHTSKYHLGHGYF